MLFFRDGRNARDDENEEGSDEGAEHAVVLENVNIGVLEFFTPVLGCVFVGEPEDGGGQEGLDGDGDVFVGFVTSPRDCGDDRDGDGDGEDEGDPQLSDTAANGLLDLGGRLVCVGGDALDFVVVHAVGAVPVVRGLDPSLTPLLEARAVTLAASARLEDGVGDVGLWLVAPAADGGGLVNFEGVGVVEDDTNGHAVVSHGLPGRALIDLPVGDRVKAGGGHEIVGVGVGGGDITFNLRSMRIVSRCTNLRKEVLERLVTRLFSLGRICFVVVDHERGSFFEFFFLLIFIVIWIVVVVIIE